MKSDKFRETTRIKPRSRPLHKKSAYFTDKIEKKSAQITRANTVYMDVEVRT